MNAIAQLDNKPRGLAAVMAERFQMEPARFVEAIKATVISGQISDGQLAAFLMVAHEYNLNPLTKEIYAFPSKGGIQPIVSIDGWMKLINSHPQFDGMEFTDSTDESGGLVSITCRIFRKDRARPTEATEYMDECRRSTEPWQKWPRRMLRHKAAIQAARYAFSFAMMDEDDFDRLKDVTPRTGLSERLAAGDTTHSEGFTIEHEPSASSPADDSGGVVTGSPPDAAAPHSGDVPPESPEQAPAAVTPSPAAGADFDKLRAFARQIVPVIGADTGPVSREAKALVSELGITDEATIGKARAITSAAMKACSLYDKPDALPLEDALELIAGLAGCEVRNLVEKRRVA